MTLSKLLGFRSRTLEASAPARRDSEKNDDRNFMMKCVQYEEWIGKKAGVDIRKSYYISGGVDVAFLPGYVATGFAVIKQCSVCALPVLTVLHCSSCDNKMLLLTQH